MRMAMSTGTKDKTPKRPIQPRGREEGRGGFAAKLLAQCARAELLQYGVFERLGRAQADHSLGLDLDRFARGGVAAHARLTVRFHRASDTRDHELAGALGFLDRELEELVEKGGRLLLGDRLVRGADLVSNVGDDL